MEKQPLPVDPGFLKLGREHQKRALRVCYQMYMKVLTSGMSCSLVSLWREELEKRGYEQFLMEDRNE